MNRETNRAYFWQYSVLLARAVCVINPEELIAHSDDVQVAEQINGTEIDKRTSFFKATVIQKSQNCLTKKIKFIR